MAKCVPVVFAGHSNNIRKVSENGQQYVKWMRTHQIMPCAPSTGTGSTRVHSIGTGISHGVEIRGVMMSEGARAISSTTVRGRTTCYFLSLVMMYYTTM
jgi:hypothetical protein